MRGLGYTQEAIDQALADESGRNAEADDAVFWVWEDNKTAWEFFRFIDRQWRYGAMGGVLGLDLATAVVLMPAFKIHNQRRVLEDLKEIEGAVLPILNQKADT